MPDASIISTSYGQTQEELFKFIEHHLACIEESSYSANLILILERSESNKHSWIKNAFEKYLLSKVLIVSSIPMERGKGFSACLNYACEISTAEYLMRADTDDFMAKDRINIQVGKMNEENLDFTCMNMKTIDKHTLRYPRDLHEVYLSILLGMNPIAHVTTCYRRSFFESHCFYDEKLSRCEDFDLWIRLLTTRNFKYRHIDEAACTYSLDASYNKDHENAREQIRLRIAYSKRLILLGTILLLGILPNIIRVLLPNRIILRLRRKINLNVLNIFET